MTPGKLRKSVLKRFKITKNKKVLRRISGINHFLSKKHRDLVRKKRRLIDSNLELIEDYLNY
jgi:ribosomal protein L35